MRLAVGLAARGWAEQPVGKVVGHRKIGPSTLEACGVACEDAARETDAVDVKETRIPVANKHLLIRTKQMIRPQDHLDCRYLETRLLEESKNKV